MVLILRDRLADPTPDWETRLGLKWAKGSGRSWWALRYTDGTIVHEWDADPGSPNGHMDWPRMRKQGRQALRLYYPDGRLYSQLGDTLDCTGKLFQLKSAVRTTRVSMSAGAVVDVEDRGQAVMAHAIGMVVGLNGECVCFAWEPLPPPEPPSGAPKRPNPYDDYYLTGRAGLLADHERRFRSEIAAYKASPLYQEWLNMLKVWRFNGCGRIVGPFEDNVYHMAYQNAGKLSADVLGIDDGEGR